MIKLKDILSEGYTQEFYGFYKGKKIKFKADYPSDAKKHTIDKFKVPKSKWGEVIILSKSEYDKQQSWHKQYNEGKLTEGKFKMKGKYLYFPDGEVSSIPGNYDRDAIVVGIKNDTFKIYMQNGKLYTAGNKYDKTFKNGNDLENWLNKNKAKYYGIDNR